MRSRRQTGSFKSRLLLAAFPVAIVLILISVEIVASQHLLFTSLVSSAFLIYIRHDSPMNESTTIAISQGIAAVMGLIIFLILGKSFLSAALSLILVTIVLVYIRKLHPPALATSLIFNYRSHEISELLLFGLLVLLVVLLIITKYLYGKLHDKLQKAGFDLQ